MWCNGEGLVPQSGRWGIQVLSLTNLDT